MAKTINYNFKKRTYTGTDNNDILDASLLGYEPNGKTNIKKNLGLNINGGKGSDEITGTIYNDTITGGIGNNTFNYSKGFGHDIINLTKGENFILKFDDTLTLDDLNFEYTNKNKDLKISYNNNEGSITLKNFASKNVTNNANTKKGIVDSSSVELIIDNITYDLRSNQKDGEYWYEVNPTGNFTGGWLNDHISAKNTSEIKDKRNNHVDLVLKGGAGDDLIESSMTADKITGGTGHNTIKYTSLEQLKGDKVYLTKGEKLDIDISEMDGATATYCVNKNDLVVTVEHNGEKENFTIINFGTKDVTNNSTKKTNDNSEINLITSDDTFDLRKGIEVSTNSGTYHNDNINRSNYDVWEDKNKTIRSSNWNKTGLTIKGLAGDDTITGTDYSDKIYGNAGTDTINAGTGNNYLYFNKGDGNDIVENGNGVDTLVFANKTNLTYSYDKYDLVIKYSDNDTVTLKDYLKGHSVQYIQIGKTRTSFNPQRPQFNEYNEDGYHVIEGTVIADTIVGTNNNDKIFGNEDDDNIDGKKGSDILDGGAGVNTYSFTSGDGNDIIVNGTGTDTIEFDKEYDLSYSRYLNGNDLIINYGNNDSVTLQDYFVNNSHSTSTILNGTKELNISEEVVKGYFVIGTNSVETFDGTVDVPFTYVINGGTDLIQNSKNADTIKLDTQETISYSKASNSDDLVITYGDNKVTVKDYFNTENHVQRIVNRTNTLNIAEEIENKLEIVIPENETNITGTKNNDTIHLKDSGISLIVSEGDGKDTVYSGTSEDTLVISNKTFDDLSYKKENNDLIISYSANDSVTLKNYFTEEHSIKNITAGESTELLADKIKLYFNGTNNAETITGTDYDDIITSNKGNDTVSGGKGNNTYIFVSGDGKDTIVNGQGNDTIRFNSKLDLRFSHNLQNNDLVLAYSNNDTITLQNYYVNNSHSVNTIQNGTETLTIAEALNTYGIDITGTLNPESISGTLVNDTIIGGRGSDEIDGGSGNNTYIFNTGDGTDTIINGTGTDTIKFNTNQTLTYTHNLANNDLVIGYGNNDSIILKDYFVGNSHSVSTIINNTQTLDLFTEITKGMTTIGTSNSESIDGTIGDDIIRSNGGTDIITAGKGIDKLYSGSGNSTYIFSLGNGRDEIYSGSGQDTLVINSVTFNDLSYEKYNNDLVINYSNEDSITLKNYFITTHSVKNITVAGETKLLADKIKLSFNGTNSSETITGTDYDDIITSNQGNDTINGGLGNNLYVFNQNDGKDTIIKGNGTDTVKFNQTQDIRFARDFSNNDLVIKYGNNDTITLQNYYVNNSHSVKTIINGTESLTLEEALNAYGMDITGTNGDNNITGTFANDTINAGQGNDVIDGGSGNNIYVFNTDDGTDTIINGDGIDTIKFNTSQTLSYTKDIPNKNLIISYGNNDTITLQNYFAGNTHSVKTIQNGSIILTIADEILKGMTFIGSSSADTIDGTDYSDVIKSIAGNDTITSNKGNDDLYSGSGNSRYIFNLGDGKDTIYSGTGQDTIEINGVTFDDLTYKKDNNNLLINYSNNDSITLINFFSSTHSVKNIKIGDTTDLLDNRIKDLIIDGTSSSETINGTEYDDIITPNGGTDTIDGNAGNNTYVFKMGDGTNNIVKSTGTDKVVLQNNSTIKLSRDMSNQDLVINYGTDSNVVLKDYFINSNHSVKSIVINDTEKTISNLIAEYGIEYIGTNNGETINGTEGNDIIVSYEGDDVIDGALGNNIYIFNSGDGNDKIINSNGNDTIKYNITQPLKYYHNLANDDLVILYGNNDTIILKDYFIENIHSVKNIINEATIINVNNDTIDKAGLTIIGSINKDIIIGTNSDDTITIGEDDIIYATSGNDTIYGYWGSLNINCNMSDLIFEKKPTGIYSANKEIYNVIISGYSENSTITLVTYIKNGNINYSPINKIILNDSTLTFYAINIGTNEDDILKESYRTELMFGYDGNDELHGSGIIYGGDGDDIIYSYGAEVYGEKGNDIVYASSGIINCGTGNNTIYKKNSAGAVTTIYGGGGKDILVLDLKLFARLRFIEKEDFISIINTEHPNDTLYIDKSNNSIYKIQTNDAVVQMKDIIIGTNNADVLYGTNSSNCIYANNGNDTIFSGNGNNEILLGRGNNTIYLGDGNNHIYCQEGGGNNIIYLGNGGNWIDIDGTGYDTYITTLSQFSSAKGYSLNHPEKINSNGYNSTILDEDGYDTLILNNSLEDVVLYFDVDSNGKICTMLSLDNKNYLDDSYKLTINGWGYDIENIIVSNNTDDIYSKYSYDLSKIDSIGLQLKQWLRSNNYQNPEKVFKSGNIEDINAMLAIFNQAWVPTIYGTYNDDIINCGSGNNTIGGGLGNDTYVYNEEACGNDIILNGVGDDSISFGTETYLFYSKNIDSNNLVITYNNGTIELKDFFINNTHSVKTIDNNGTILQVIDQIVSNGIKIINTTSTESIEGTIYSNTIINNGIVNNNIQGGCKNDTITNNGIVRGAVIGGLGDDMFISGENSTKYIFRIGDGDDTIYNSRSSDTLQFENIDLDSLIWNKIGEDLIIKYGSNNSITLKDYFLTGYNVKITNGTDNSRIYDKFYMNLHNSNISKPSYGDYSFNSFSEECSVTYKAYSYSIRFNNNTQWHWYTNYQYYSDILYNGIKITPTKYTGPYELISASLPSNNSHILYGCTIRLYLDIPSDSWNQYINRTGTATKIIEKILGDNTNNLINNSEAKIIYAGQGDDYLYGGYGQTFEFFNGDGNDILYTYSSADKLSFNKSDFAWEKANDDLIIKYNNSADSLTIKNYFSSTDKISTINSSTIESLINNVKISGNSTEINNIMGTQYSDIIYGGSANDTLRGVSGDDTIYGGAGNDFITGGNGNDILYGEEGDDRLAGNGASNILYGGVGSDTYINSDLTNYETIYDESGNNDSISITEVNKNSLVLRFDIQVDGEGNILDYLSKNMYITNTADFGNAEKGIKVTNQFIEGHSIENIKTADNYTLTTTQINQLRSDVAGWLHDNGFESVQQILDSNNETNISNLIAEFQKANWQQG